MRRGSDDCTILNMMLSCPSQHTSTDDRSPSRLCCNDVPLLLNVMGRISSRVECLRGVMSIPTFHHGHSAMRHLSFFPLLQSALEKPLSTSRS